MKIKLAKSEIIHFVGIGGIGMSGLSLIMRGKGFKIQGSDISTNKNIERLKKEKIKITETIFVRRFLNELFSIKYSLKNSTGKNKINKETNKVINDQNKP